MLGGADSAASEAKDAMRMAYPTVYNATDNEADAFRHAYWNFVMAQSYGYETTILISNAYERAHPGNMISTAMDLYNNRVGALLGISNSMATSITDRSVIITNAVSQNHLISKAWYIDYE